jgi:cyclase
MLARRVTPCFTLDGWRLAGSDREDGREPVDPLELALRYHAEGADEIVLLELGDAEGRTQRAVESGRRFAEELLIPLSLGGGFDSLLDVGRALDSGADRVILGSAARLRPDLVTEVASRFGPESVALILHAARGDPGDGPRWRNAGAGEDGGPGGDLLAWAVEAAERGAGELILSPVGGERDGPDLELLQALADLVMVPLAAAGLGSAEAALEAVLAGGAEGLWLGAALHRGYVSVGRVKDALRVAGESVRVVTPRAPRLPGRIDAPGVRGRPVRDDGKPTRSRHPRATWSQPGRPTPLLPDETGPFAPVAGPAEGEGLPSGLAASIGIPAAVPTSVPTLGEALATGPEPRWDADGRLPLIVRDARDGRILALRSITPPETEAIAADRRWSSPSVANGAELAVHRVLLAPGGDLLVLEVHGPADLEGAGVWTDWLPSTGPLPGLALSQAVRDWVLHVARRRKERVEGSYTSYLFDKGLDKILRKLGEASTDLLLAAKAPDAAELPNAAADLLVHLLVLLEERQVPDARVAAQLGSRRGGRREG